MKNKNFNLKLSALDILKVCKCENVFLIPVGYVSEYPQDNEIVYIENDTSKVCHTEELFSILEIANEVLIPLTIHESQSNTPYPFKVAQTLYSNLVLNNVLEWISDGNISDFINISLSLTDKTYDPNIVASVYFISDIQSINSENLSTINDKFIKDNNIALSFKSSNNTHVYLHKQDTINIYDIAKYANYIKLKGFADNIIHIDLEVRKKSFDVFDIKNEIYMFIKYFFGEEVWNQR